MMTSSHIFLGLISSTFVSDLFGSIRRIFYLIFVRPYFNVTAPFIKHRVIINGPFDGISCLYAA